MPIGGIGKISGRNYGQKSRGTSYEELRKKCIENLLVENPEGSLEEIQKKNSWRNFGKNFRRVPPRNSGRSFWRNAEKPLEEIMHKSLTGLVRNYWRNLMRNFYRKQNHGTSFRLGSPREILERSPKNLKELWKKTGIGRNFWTNPAGNAGRNFDRNIEKTSWGYVSREELLKNISGGTFEIPGTSVRN